MMQCQSSHSAVFAASKATSKIALHRRREARNETGSRASAGANGQNNSNVALVERKPSEHKQRHKMNNPCQVSSMPLEQEERNMNDENEPYFNMDSPGNASAVEYYDPPAIWNSVAARRCGQGHRQAAFPSEATNNDKTTEADTVIQDEVNKQELSLNILADISTAKLNIKSSKQLVARRPPMSLSPIAKKQKHHQSRNPNLSDRDADSLALQSSENRRPHLRYSQGLQEDGPKYPIGTSVLKYFQDNGWLYGTITFIDMDFRYYYIVYSNGDYEYFGFEEETSEIDPIVDRAASAMPYFHPAECNETVDRNFASLPSSTTFNGDPISSPIIHNQRYETTKDHKNTIVEKLSLAARTFGGHQRDISPMRRTSNLQESLPQSHHEPNLRWSEVIAIDLNDDEPSDTSLSKSVGGNMSPKYLVRTKVRKFFPGNGWHNGEICEIDIKNRSYRVRYNYTDGISYEYPFQGATMNKMVQDAQEFEDQSKTAFSFEDVETEGSIVSPPNKTKHATRNRCPNNSQNKNSTKRPATEPHPMDNAHAIIANLENDPALASYSDEPEPKKQRIDKIKTILSDEQRMKLQGIELNIYDFTNFLVEHERLVSTTTVEYVKAARKLVSGDWSSDVAFQVPPVRDMTVNFHRIRQDFIIHAKKYQLDGSGAHFRKCALLSKLERFQADIYSKVTKQPPLITKLKPAKTRVLLKNILNNQERSELVGKKVDFNAFSEYLTKTQGLSERHKANMLCRAKRFVSGQEIRSTRWPDGVVFRPRPILSLSDDISLMMQDAKRHEEKYCRGLSKGRLWQPYTKLINFQTYVYQTQVLGKEFQESVKNEA